MFRSSNGTLNGDLNRSSGPHRARSNDHFSFRAGRPPTQGGARLATPFPGERQTLARLAQFSSRHAEELRRLELQEADSRRENRIHDWCTAISTEGNAAFRRLLSDRFDAAADYEQRQSSVARNFLLTEWDAAEHPRVPKGQPGGGQWVDKDGGSGVARGRAKGVTAKSAIYSGPKRVRLQYVGWKAVGHHWVPVGVVQLDEIRPLLTKDAVRYAAGSYSGATFPSHNARPVNCVKHSIYSDHVKKELLRYMKLNGITTKNKMTVAQMEKFVGFIENGLGADGKRHKPIARFNLGIKSMVKKGVQLPKTRVEILKAGIREMSKRSFQMLAATAVISTMAGKLLADEVAILNVAQESPHFKQAIWELQQGNLATAQRLLAGGEDSFYVDLLGKVSAAAALNFQRSIEAIFSQARNKTYE